MPVSVDDDGRPATQALSVSSADAVAVLQRLTACHHVQHFRRIWRIRTFSGSHPSPIVQYNATRISKLCVSTSMISPNLYRKSRVYDFFMKSFGYSKSIERYLSDLKLDLPSGCRILDAGCGTGILGLHFLQRFPESTLLATDLETNFLKATLANAEKRGIDLGRIESGVADISDPHIVESPDGSKRTVDDHSFDLICIGAVVGYARDTESALRQLVSMLAPGGYLVNVEMNSSPSGRLVSHRYQYDNISLFSMRKVLESEGCETQISKLRVSHLPAKLTRTGVLARKPA